MFSTFTQRISKGNAYSLRTEAGFLLGEKGNTLNDYEVAKQKIFNIHSEVTKANEFHITVR